MKSIYKATDCSLICRRGPVNRLSPVMSSSYAEAEHVPDNGQTDRAQAWRLLLVPAVVTATLSRVIDGKGLLLASYWALRYFAPAALSLWAAKRARKHWDFLSATMVMAATYAVSMAASYRIWTGPTSTYKMHYPLFKGKITIPAVVGQWIRHNRGLAKILTKMLAWGPWVFLTLAAALQIAVWMDGTARCKAQQRVAAKPGSQHSNPEGIGGLSPSAAGAQATAPSAAPPAASSAALAAPVSHSDSAGGGTTDFRAEQTSQQPPVAAAQSRTASTSAELQAAHGAEEEEEQNSSTHSNGDSQVDGSPDAYAYLTQLSGILRAVFAHLCSLEHGDKFEKEHAVYLRKQLDVVHEYHHLRLGFSCELCSLLRSYMEDTLEAAMKSVQCGNFDAYLARTKTYHAKIFAGVEDYLEVGPHAELLRKREALIEHLMPGALEEAAKQSSHQDLEHSSERSPIAPGALHSNFAEVHDAIAEEGEGDTEHWDEDEEEDDEDDDDDKAEQESDSDAEDEDEQGDYEETDAMIAHGSSQLKILEGSSDRLDQSWAVRRQSKADSMEAKHEAVQADESRTSTANWLMPHGAGADQARLKGQLANAEDSQVSKLQDITHRRDQIGQLKGNFETQLEAAEQRVQQLEEQLTDQLDKLQLEADTGDRVEAALELKLLARKLQAARLARLNIVTDSHIQHIWQLKKQHEHSIASIESDNAEQLEELQDEHEEDVASIKSEHEVQLEELRQQHEEDSASIESEYEVYEEELELLRAQHEGELEQLREDHAEELEQLREEHEDGQRKSVDDHEQQLAELREEHELNVRGHEQQIAALPMSTEKHQQELQEVESEHAQQVKELHSKLETVTAQQQSGADNLAVLNHEITSLQERQEQLQRSLSQAQRNDVYLRNVVAQKAEQHSSDVGSLREQLEEALKEEDRLRAEEQRLRKHVEVSTADHNDEVLALQDNFAVMRTQLVSEAVQVAEDLKQQLASTNLKAEQLQGELTSQQTSSETSMEALAIEHKCTKDNLQAEVDRLTAVVAELSETTAEAAHTKLLYKFCQQRVDAALTDLQQTQHELSQAQKDVEGMHQHLATAIDGKLAYETRANELAQRVKLLKDNIQDLKAESRAVEVQQNLAQVEADDKLKALTNENSILMNRVKDDSRSHTVLVEKYEALQEKFEALQEEQWLMSDRVEEILTLHEGNSSQVDQVPAPAVVQKVEDAIAADASEPAAATLTLCGNAVEDDMAATDKTSHDGSFEVEVQVESSGDEEDSASGAVQVNVHSARDMPGKVEIHIENGDDDDDHLASGAVNVNIHPAGVNDKPKQEGVTTMNIAKTSSDGDEFRKGDSDDDDGDGMIPVNVHTSLLG